MPEPTSSGTSAPRYRIDEDIEGSFLATSETGRIALLVPTTETRPPAERASGDVILSFPAKVRFQLTASAFEANAAVVECANDDLAQTFRVMALDVAQRVRARTLRPTPQEVSQALLRWEELLRAKRTLSREEEIGLWGELWLMSQLPELSLAVASWRGPDAEWVDFVGGGVGIECKASRRRLEHFVSQEQVTRPLGDLGVYLLSMWVDVDATAGRTLADMVSDIDQRLDDRREFEEKLLETGYSRADAHRYKFRLRLLEPPLLFPSDAVPRVRAADPGITHIRFMASLNENVALSPTAGLEVMMRLCGV
jgi:hypothetical protein